MRNGKKSLLERRACAKKERQDSRNVIAGVAIIVAVAVAVDDGVYIFC